MTSSQMKISQFWHEDLLLTQNVQCILRKKFRTRESTVGNFDIQVRSNIIPVFRSSYDNPVVEASDTEFDS